MAILVNEATRVLVQGITGKVGSFQVAVLQEYGTRVMAGVTPGKGGTAVHGIPVYDFVEDAVAGGSVDVALSFVPARFAKDASIEAIENGIPLLVLTTAGIPEHDLLAILGRAAARGTRVLGPDTPGLVSPGACKVGVHPNRVLRKGWIGVVSKSGALSYEVCRLLSERGFGQSTVVGIGGGPLWGTSQSDVIAMFEQDPQTRAIVLLGEVGGTMEHEAAAFIHREVTKPVVAMIVGRSAPPGAQMGHAGALIAGEGETAERKLAALREAGCYLARSPVEILSSIEKLGGQFS